MTEEEAKTKWCPFARVYSIGGQTNEHDGDTCNGSWNRHPDNGDLPRCIGSACMAWRWAETAEETRKRLAHDGSIIADALTNKFDAIDAKVKSARTAFCGLAGKP